MAVLRVCGNDGINISARLKESKCALDGRTTHVALARAAEYANSEEDRIGELRFAKEAERITWHFPLLKNDERD